MTIATDPQQPPAPGTPPVTMLNPDFPFSYDLYLAHPAGLAPRWPWSAPACPVW
jgi:tryptophan 2-monooxygenase